MEQRLFDADSLVDAVTQAVSDEILADLPRFSSSSHDAEMSFARSRDLDTVKRFAEEVAEKIAVQVVAEVVDYSDYATNLLLGLATQEVQERTDDHGHNVGKTNASPSWRRSLQRSRMDLSNTVITAWPTFDNVLARAAQAVVKDRSKEIAAAIVSAAAATVAAVSGEPVAGVAVATVLSPIASVVAEIIAQLATIATGIEYVDPALQCVFQRAIRMARYDPNKQVSVHKLVKSFSLECSSPYLEEVIECPFRSTDVAGDDGDKEPVRCLLADVSGRPKDWRDDEELEVKVRRMMRKLESQKVLSSRVDRHSDTYFRSERLVTGFDRIGGR